MLAFRSMYGRHTRGARVAPRPLDAGEELVGRGTGGVGVDACGGGVGLDERFGGAALCSGEAVGRWWGVAAAFDVVQVLGPELAESVGRRIHGSPFLPGGCLSAAGHWLSSAILYG